MNITPEASLQVIAALLKRLPMNEAELVGAQCAVDCLEATNKELKDLKSKTETTQPPS